MADATLNRSWVEQLEALYIDLAEHGAGSASAVLREARNLIMCPPLRAECPAASFLSGAYLSEERFTALLDLGAEESAVLALIGPGAGYMVSRGPNGVCLASIILPGMKDDICAEGSSFAVALVSAYIAALIDYCRPVKTNPLQRGSHTPTLN